MSYMNFHCGSLYSINQSASSCIENKWLQVLAVDFIRLLRYRQEEMLLSSFLSSVDINASALREAKLFMILPLASLKKEPFAILANVFPKLL